MGFLKCLQIRRARRALIAGGAAACLSPRGAYRGGTSPSRDHGADLARDLEVLSCLDDERPRHCRTGADVGVAAGGGVALRVQRDAEEPEARGGRRSAPLAHAPGKDESVQAAQGRRHRSDTGAQAVHLDVQRQRRIGVPTLDACQHLARSPGPASARRPD
jgi:hypothetical protein